MTTDIRLLFRHGPATIIRFQGSFSNFIGECAAASNRMPPNQFVPYPDTTPTALINLSELACAYVHAEYPDEHDEPRKEPT